VATVTWFQYAQGFLPQPGGDIAVWQPLKRLDCERFPHWQTLAIGFELRNIDLTRDNLIAVHFYAPHRISPLATAERHTKPKWGTKKAVFQHHLRFEDLPLELEGEYFSILYINGRKAGIFPLSVKRKRFMEELRVIT
jgi:hypothetical protein